MLLLLGHRRRRRHRSRIKFKSLLLAPYPYAVPDSFFETVIPGFSVEQFMSKTRRRKSMASRSSSPPSPGPLPLIPASWQLMPPPHLQSPEFFGPPPYPMLPVAPMPPAGPMSPHSPPPPATGDLVRSQEITITHSKDAPASASTSYFDDPYNIGTPHYESTHKHVALQYHICSICRRPRSTRFHQQHPLVPGQQIIPEPCRKCRSAVSSSSSEDDRKIIVNKPGKRAVRESERVRIVAMDGKDHHGRGRRHHHR